MGDYQRRICPQILIIVYNYCRIDHPLFYLRISNNQLYNMNTLMNVVYIAFAAVFVSAQFNTALADVVSPTPIFLSTFSTHTPALVTRISHALLVFSLAPDDKRPDDERPVPRARGPVVLSSPPFPPP